MPAHTSEQPGVTGAGHSPAVIDWLNGHYGICEDIAALVGFSSDGDTIRFQYEDAEGKYFRTRNLPDGKTMQPKGRKLSPWVPLETDGALLVLEGESDLLSAASALYTSENLAADGEPPEFEPVRRENLPPPVENLVPVAVPGVGNCHRQVADLAEELVADVLIAFDGDDAGRENAAKLAAKINAKPNVSAAIVPLPDGQDVSDFLGAVPTLAELAEPLANLVAEAQAAGEVPAEGDVGSENDAPVLPSPSAPMDVARALIEQLDLAEQLRHWRGSWWEWRRSHWIEVEARGVRSKLYRATEHATYVNGEGDLKPWAPNRQKIANLVEALAAIDHLHDQVDMPTWLDGREQVGPIVAAENGLLDVERRELLPHSPAFFNRVSVPFAFEANPPAPERWLSFLADLWPDDPESIAALQEFFGYVLSGRLDQHKILLLVGPTRAGKGVITRILGALVGPQNVAGPTLSSMGGNFGLAPLLGKPLAIVSDARLSGRNSQVTVERLLAISGEDAITIDRKYRDQWTGKLPCRFVIVSNELPQLGDASAAIANRFVPLVLGRSWLGKEDRSLEGDLRRELPGILTWALDGLQRLQEQGRFTSPPSAEEALATLIDLASPTGAFLRESCELQAGAAVDVDDLWVAWKAWCDGAGQPPGTKAMLGRNLRAAQPQVRKSRPLDQDGNKRNVYLGVGLRGAE